MSAAAASSPASSGSSQGTAGGGERASASAWITVAAGTLGALMSTLDISIVNSSLPTIQGEIGATGSEGTWIATAYLVAEIIVIPLSGWLEKLFGLRGFLLICSSMFTLFSMVCGLSTSLTMMIFGRVGQGFFGGALIPTAMTIIATYLPRSQQPIGNAMFGATAVLGPVIGPILGGWLTENWSWHYAFFINLPLGTGLFAMLFLAMPKDDPDFGQLRHADWFGIVGLALWLGAMTVVLEEGEREQWFDSPMILYLTLISVIGFVLLMIGQRTAKRPVIQLSLLLDRQFGSVVLMSMVVGMAIFGTSYAIPQFLSSVAGYNALQSGQVVLLTGVPMMLMMPLVPILLKKLDVRLAVFIGMAMLSVSSYLLAFLNTQSAGVDFTESQLIRGVGTVLAMMFLNQAAIQSVSTEQAADASGLFNAARNLGGSFALAGIAVVQDQRLWLHSRRMEESLSANSSGVQTYFNGISLQLGSDTAAYRAIDSNIQLQALTMTYSDLFWILAVGIAAVIPLVMFLRPLPKDAEPAAMG